MTESVKEPTPRRDSQWLQFTVTTITTLVTGVLSFFGGYLQGAGAQKEKNELNTDTVTYRKQYAALYNKYSSLGLENGALNDQNQRLKADLQTCRVTSQNLQEDVQNLQEAAKIMPALYKKNSLPPKAVRNLLFEPEGGLVGIRNESKVVFKFRLSTEDNESRAYLNTQSSSIVGEDGNTYQAVYAVIGGHSTDDRHDRTIQETFYRGAPVRAEYQFSVPKEVKKASALSLDINGQRVLFSDVVIRWQ